MNGLRIEPWLAGNVRFATQVFADFFQLSKPTISLLVVVTAIPALTLAGDEMPSMKLVIGVLIGTWLASASASILNHVVDKSVDLKMTRTIKRPIPAGRISDWSAVLVAFFLAGASFFLLLNHGSSTAAWIALIGNVFYVVVYTIILKPRTVQNIVIGGAAGAVGPLIGWSAVTGQVPSWPAWMMAALIFLWTPPHFWALALKYKKDYAAAGIPMMPVVKGNAATIRQILFYSFALLPVVVSLYIGNVAGALFLVVGIGMTAIFVYLAWRLYLKKSDEAAMRLFHYSCFYLLGVFGALFLDSVLV